MKTPTTSMMRTATCKYIVKSKTLISLTHNFLQINNYMGGFTINGYTKSIAGCAKACNDHPKCSVSGFKMFMPILWGYNILLRV